MKKQLPGKVKNSFDLVSNQQFPLSLVITAGAQKGKNIPLDKNRIVIGRGDKTDFQLKDTKASREHAEIVKNGEKLFVTDLKSQNGIFVNEKKTTQRELFSGDILIIGSTAISISPNENYLTEYTENEDHVTGNEEKKEDQSKKLVLLALVLFVTLFIPWGKIIKFQPQKKVRQTSSSHKKQVDFTKEYRKKVNVETRELNRKLEQIFQRGLREYRSGNYYRAIAEFDQALSISPRNSKANRYLSRTKQDLNNEIENRFKVAKKEENALKFRSAIVTYCSILRLLSIKPEDERIELAKERINILEGYLGFGDGESRCI